MLTVMRHRRNAPLSGQTLVLFALMSLLLLAGLGLIFDAGLDYSNRRTMQNAADTAAIRGARVIAQKAADADDPNPSIANAFVDREVKSTAVANGVPDSSNVICSWLDDDLDDLGACDDGPIPVDVTGIKVRVSETHTPLVMRALGIMTTGTAASAAAQVQMAINVDGRDFPFMVCGVDTALTNGGEFSILTTEPVSDPGIPTASPVVAPRDFDVATGDFTIVEDAYSYDWNKGGTVTLLDADAPEFDLYGDDIEHCGKDNWKGRASRAATNFIRLDPSGDYGVTYPFVLGDITGVNDASSYRSINGPQGCRVQDGIYPTNCVMILPIGDTSPWCPTLLAYCPYYATAEDRDAGLTDMIIRRWGAFYVQRNSGTGEYTGRLIKNYPMHSDGVVGWDPTSYVGPLSITLIQTP